MSKMFFKYREDQKTSRKMIFKGGLFHYLLGFVFCTLWSFAFSQVSLKYSQEFSYGNFLRIAGYFLDVKPIVPASSEFNSIECGLKCILTTGCVSYNYKNGGSGGINCQLLAVDRFFNSTILQKNDDFDYYYTKRICDDAPCLNNGKCISYIHADNYTCECTASFKGLNCSEPICSKEAAHGMASGAIKDDQLAMSSYYNNDATYGESNGRLNKSVWPYGAQTSTSDSNPWFQINLLTPKVITAVGIQGYGFPNGASWTTSYQISSSLDGTNWEWYQENPGINKTLAANTDAHTEVRSRLKVPIKVKLIKIWATACQGYCTFRLELYGCSL